MGWYAIWVAIGLLMVAAPFVYATVLVLVIGPFRVHASRGVPANPAWENTRAEDLSPEMREAVGALVRQFAAEGFGVVSNLALGDGGYGSRGVQVYLVNREAGDAAVVVCSF